MRLENLFKSIFYFLGYKMEQICIPGTQKLFWKTARKCWNDELVGKMRTFRYQDSKDEEFRPYQTLNYIERNINDLSPEYICNYNHALGLVHKWMGMVIE